MKRWWMNRTQQQQGRLIALGLIDVFIASGFVIDAPGIALLVASPAFLLCVLIFVGGLK